VDKVYQRKNVEMAWEKVKANRGSGGVDGQSLELDHVRALYRKKGALELIHGAMRLSAPVIDRTRASSLRR
jgi:hypothetical protein